MRFLRSSKYSKTAWNSLEQLVELTQKLTAVTTVLRSWYCYIFTIVGHYHAVIIEGF